MSSLWAWAFFRFAVVGTGGFVVDTAVLYTMLALGLDLYSGRAVSYLCAATFTWYGNRTITFSEARASGAANIAAEWLRFIVTNLGGGAVNYTVYAVLVTYSEVVRAYPIMGVAAGALSGMTVNFLVSRWLVFTGNRAG
ncbi:MAG: GtrA family protein [Alphaproteobacteria bacterium]|nr:GtrA family protein [Alphaproteobacteria bacterium]